MNVKWILNILFKLFLLLSFLSCNNEQRNTPHLERTDINNLIEDNEIEIFFEKIVDIEILKEKDAAKEEYSYAIEDIIPIEINFEKSGLQNRLLIGNILMVIPDEYMVGIWDGVENEFRGLHNQHIVSGDGYNRNFHITIFRKDSDFADPDGVGFNKANLALFEDFINGISNTKPPGFPWSQIRRNIFNDINVLEAISFAQFSIDAAHQLRHEIVFTDDDYFYHIRIVYWGDEVDNKIRLFRLYGGREKV